MTNHNPFVITPMPSLDQWRALRAQLDADVTSILHADGQQLAQSEHDRLIDRLTEAVLFATAGFDFSGAASLDQSTVATVKAMETAQVSDQQWKSEATYFSRVARTIAGRVRRARKRPIQAQRQGAGRPVDVWKGALLDHVERALRSAGVERAYYTTEKDAAEKTVLPAIFSACVKAAGHRIPKDLRNIQRGRFRPTRLLPFNPARFSVRKLAKAIWQFLPLKR